MPATFSLVYDSVRARARSLNAVADGIARTPNAVRGAASSAQNGLGDLPSALRGALGTFESMWARQGEILAQDFGVAANVLLQFVNVVQNLDENPDTP